MHACIEDTTGTEVPVLSLRGLWLRRLLVLLGFLVGAWVLVTLTDQQRAEAAPTPPVRPILASVVASAPIPVAADVSAVLTPVTAAGSNAVDHLTATAAQVGTTARHVSATVVATLAGTGTNSHGLLHLPQVRQVVRGHKIRHGAPPPVSSSAQLGAVHRVAILPAASTPKAVSFAAVRTMPTGVVHHGATHAPRNGASHGAVSPSPSAPRTPAPQPAPSAPAPFAALPGNAAGQHGGGAQTELAFCLPTSPTARDTSFVRRVAYRAPALLSITGTPPVSPD